MWNVNLATTNSNRQSPLQSTTSCTKDEKKLSQPSIWTPHNPQHIKHLNNSWVFQDPKYSILNFPMLYCEKMIKAKCKNDPWPSMILMCCQILKGNISKEREPQIRSS